MTSATPADLDLPDTTTERDGETYTLSGSRKERGTRFHFGRPYFYGRNARGNLVLLQGHDPRVIDFDTLATTR